MFPASENVTAVRYFLVKGGSGRGRLSDAGRVLARTKELSRPIEFDLRSKYTYKAGVSDASEDTPAVLLGGEKIDKCLK